MLLTAHGGRFRNFELFLLLFQIKPPRSFTSEEATYLTSRIQNGGTEVVEVKLCFQLVFNVS